MAYNPNDVARLKHVAQLAQVVKSNLDALDSNAIQYVSTSGNTVSFFTNNDGSGTAAFSFDFPEELFLDQAGTTLVENFTWSALSYPNSTNPNLDGKTVLVLAVKGDAQTPTVKYSFVDLSKLIDTYTPADNSIAINGHSVAVNISATTGNALSLANDGLLVDISAKVDKVNGKQLSSEDFTTAEKTKLGGISEGAQVNVIETVKVDNVALTPNNKAVNIDLSGKVDKVTNAPQGNIAVFGANGAIANGGLSIADISYSVATSLESGLMSASDKAKLDSFNFPNDDDVTNMLNSIFT